MKNENIHRKLTTFLKLFKNRPYHLTKYLIENDAFKPDFLRKIENSQKLSNIEEDKDIQSHFSSIPDMGEFYNSLLEESNLPIKRSENDILIDLNSRMEALIKEEKYEEAAILRDYMILNGIKKNS